MSETSNRERPILFSGPLVRAILAGTKTQTRRLLRPQPGASSVSVETGVPHVAWYWPSEMRDGAEYLSAQQRAVRCPFGQPGDRLWVREAWGLTEDENGTECVKYAADGATRVHCIDTEGLDFIVESRPPLVCADPARWRPSIHMPRWASRLTLAVEAVWIERLQAITEDDARAEGCSGRDPNPENEGGTVYAWPGRSSAPCPRAHFAALWDSLAPEGSRWSDSPWVWVVSFRRVDAAARAA